MKPPLADMQLPHSEIDNGNAHAALPRTGDVSETDAGAFRWINGVSLVLFEISPVLTW